MIVITGATGQLGGAVVERLLERVGGPPGGGRGGGPAEGFAERGAGAAQ